MRKKIQTLMLFQVQISECIDNPDSNRSSDLSSSNDENDKEEENKIDKETQINTIYLILD